MNRLAEHKSHLSTLGDRVSYVRGLCGQATADGLGGGHPGRHIFDDLDYVKIARYVGGEPLRIFNPETKSWSELSNSRIFTMNEITDGILAAIDDKKINGLVKGLITTEHILFQFYLAQR